MYIKIYMYIRRLSGRACGRFPVLEIPSRIPFQPEHAQQTAHNTIQHNSSRFPTHRTQLNLAKQTAHNRQHKQHTTPRDAEHPGDILQHHIIYPHTSPTDMSTHHSDFALVHARCLLAVLIATTSRNNNSLTLEHHPLTCPHIIQKDHITNTTHNTTGDNTPTQHTTLYARTSLLHCGDTHKWKTHRDGTS